MTIITYINEDEQLACDVTGLSLDEIETVVGRFKKHSMRAGLLRGKVVETNSGLIQIRTCFGNKLLWTRDE